MIYKFTIVFLPAFGIGYCAVPDLLPPSELDWALCSSKCIKHVKSFNIKKDTSLLTDHAVLTIVLGNFDCTPEDLLSRAMNMNKSIGDQPDNITSRYPMKMCNVNTRLFMNNLPKADSLWDATFSTNQN